MPSTLRASSSWRVRIGFPPTSSITFGRRALRGWRRCPLPAAATTQMRGRLTGRSGGARFRPWNVSEARAQYYRSPGSVHTGAASIADRRRLDTLADGWVRSTSGFVPASVSRSRVMTTTAPTSRSLEQLEFAYVELSVKCNLCCQFCDNGMRNLYRDIPLRLFRSLVDQLKPGTRLGLHGLGEPTLHKDLVELIGYAKGRGLYVYFNTNHTVTTEAQMRGFVEKGLDELRISMSAGSRAAFAAYAGRDLFDALVARIRRMVEIRGARATPLLRLVFVLTQQSYPEFDAVLALADEIGVDELQVQSFLN